MTESKTKLEADVQRITAIIHLNELAAKSPIIHEWVLEIYQEILVFAKNNNISQSKINPNDILNTIYNRVNGSIHDGGNGIMADL